MTAPIIPGLNDQEIPALLEAARDAGAGSASYTLLRLPLAVRPIFEEWVTRSSPDKAPRHLALVRETHGGRMNQSQFGRRMRGARVITPRESPARSRCFARSLIWQARCHRSMSRSSARRGSKEPNYDCSE